MRARVYIVAGLALGGCVAADRGAQEARSNLLQIGVALRNYQSSQGVFPPAIVSDTNGHSQQSWRGLLLPYTEKDSPPYDPRANWNTLENLKAARLPVRIYCGTNARNNSARYLAVLGEDCIFNDGRSLTINRIENAASDIGIVVDVGLSEIPWNQPGDLALDKLLDRFDKRDLGPFPDGFYVLFADGSVRFLTYETKKDRIKKMFTIRLKDGTATSKLP